MPSRKRKSSIEVGQLVEPKHQATPVYGIDPIEAGHALHVESVNWEEHQRCHVLTFAGVRGAFKASDFKLHKKPK